MTTFSQLVDKMILESGRPDLALEIATYLRQTIRELHFEPTRGNAVFYRENRTEAQLTAVGESLYWDIPNPTTFQAMAAVQFPSVFSRDGIVWARELNPGPAMNTARNFYYRAGGRFVFSGFGGLNARVNITWFEYPRDLKYYAVNDRPASYDSEDGWTYTTAVTEEQKTAAREKSTNWLLQRWDTVIEEGVRAKIYKRVADDSRSRTSFSMYTSLRQGLYSAEVAVLGST